VARYGQAFKERAVARLLPRESAVITNGLQELGVSVSTLERWRVIARLQAVIATAGMEVTQRSAWCREQGIFPLSSSNWRRECDHGVGRTEEVPASRSRPR